jgi:hypothetical protein
MADSSTVPEASETSRAAADRAWDWSAIAGVAFVLLFMVGIGFSATSPDVDAPLGEWVDFVTDDGNGIGALISAYLFFLAAVAFVVFATGLARRVRTARGGGSPAGGYVHGLGVLAAVLLGAGGAALNNAAIPYVFEDNLGDPTDIQVFVQINSIGYGLVFVGMALAVGALIAITSWSLRNSMPTWFTLFGYITAAAMLAALFFVPLILFPIWTLAAAILLLRRPLAA